MKGKERNIVGRTTSLVSETKGFPQGSSRLLKAKVLHSLKPHFQDRNRTTDLNLHTHKSETQALTRKIQIVNKTLNTQHKATRNMSNLVLTYLKSLKWHSYLLIPLGPLAQ